MHPSYQLLLGNLHDGMSDEEFFARELHLAELAEPLGYSGIWCVEHHFDGEYSMCPDNIQLLSYLAGRTEKIKLRTAAVILPWNDPLRVTEKLVLLDYLCGGRLEVGFGRGLSRMEYAQFGIDMEEARERWEEAIEMVLRGLETGVVEGDGKFYPQPRATVRPRPSRDFGDRIMEIAMSPDSVEIAARFGASMATFVQFPIEKHKPLLDRYREAFEEHHERPAPPPTLTELIVCHEDSEEAERLHREYSGRYFTALMGHYELAGDHFADTRGYESYDHVAKTIQAAGMEDSARSYSDSNTYGTPEEIVEKVRARHEVIGDYHLNTCFSYGGIPFDQAEAGMRLFGEKVLPQLADVGVGVPAAA